MKRSSSSSSSVESVVEEFSHNDVNSPYFLVNKLPLIVLDQQSPLEQQTRLAGLNQQGFSEEVVAQFFCQSFRDRRRFLILKRKRTTEWACSPFHDYVAYFDATNSADRVAHHGYVVIKVAFER